ncbi:hypothetical protein IMSAG049_00471 [Clostridiales bacterium]|nr:hypothetical protein IMSAG049_00471 [Clostridiales bacterium]
MTYIAYFAAAIIFASIWAMFSTGRRSWIVTAFWAGIVIAVCMGAKRGLEVNGLCLFIAILEMFISIRAIYGVIIWNQMFKDKGIVLPAVIYIITVFIVGYCIIQIQKLGYVPDIMNIRGQRGIIRELINAVVLLLAAIPPTYIGILRFERFFSNEISLTLLNCRFYTSSLGGGTVFKGYYMYGICNGVKYHFRITKRSYFMLRFEDRVVLNMRKDLRGNLFAVKNPCPKKFGECGPEGYKNGKKHCGISGCLHSYNDNTVMIKCHKNHLWFL